MAFCGEWTLEQGIFFKKARDTLRRTSRSRKRAWAQNAKRKNQTNFKMGERGRECGQKPLSKSEYLVRVQNLCSSEHRTVFLKEH